MICFDTEGKGPLSRFMKKSALKGLPQVVNVFKGEMSIVGVRPLKISEIQNLSKYELRKLAVKPGMTGLWWVNLHNARIRKETIANTRNGFIEKWSFIKDLIIVLESIFLILCGRGGKYCGSIDKDQ